MLDNNLHYHFLFFFFCCCVLMLMLCYNTTCEFCGCASLLAFPHRCAPTISSHTRRQSELLTESKTHDTRTTLHWAENELAGICGHTTGRNGPCKRGMHVGGHGWRRLGHDARVSPAITRPTPLTTKETEEDHCQRSDRHYHMFSGGFSSPPATGLRSMAKNTCGWELATRMAPSMLRRRKAKRH